ncbi:MAG: hypothetical protein OCD76_14050 [Reichenbachiella sp.]
MNDLKRRKFTHIFRILDFNHDGLIEETDFLEMMENIAIFRCIEYPSKIDTLISKRGREIWKAFSDFSQTQKKKKTNLKNWLSYLENLNNIDDTIMSIGIRSAVNDIFFIFDKDDDSLLSKQEYLCLFVSLKVVIKDAHICFENLDFNKDGQISKSELILAIYQFINSDDPDDHGNYIFGNPDRLDLNRGGLLKRILRALKL